MRDLKENFNGLQFVKFTRENFTKKFHLFTQCYLHTDKPLFRITRPHYVASLLILTSINN